MVTLETDADSLKKATVLLKKGGIIIYPTDTAYALGCDATNEKAVKKIYKIKNRPAGKPLPVIVGSLALAKKFFRFSKKEFQLAKTYWPGPLSLLLKCKTKSCKPARLSLASIAVRVPNNKIARFFSSKLGRPIISTSANISGMGECYSIREVLRQFQDRKFQPDFILDGGKLKKRKPSTIIQIIKGKIEVLRKGPVRI